MRDMRQRRWYVRGLRAVLYVCAILYLATPLLGYFALEGVFAQARTGGPAVIAPAFVQSPTWRVRKLAFQVARPRFAGDTPPSCPSPCTVYPSSFLLDTSVVAQTLEPAKVGKDAAGHAYQDHNMSKLCGPGAAANALYFWGLTPQQAPSGPYTDPSDSVTTTWDADHNRAYIAYLAWRTQIPGWPQAGMMDQHDPSRGVTLYGMRDGLNWEAARHDAAHWHDYFYTVVWWNQSSADEFHHAVVDDIASAHVPVIAEVNARLLPNWSPKGQPISHFVTIVGYDDVNGTYVYTDSCGASTGCGSLKDGGTTTVAQAQMWAAITAIPVNPSTDFNAGDGGYVF